MSTVLAAASAMRPSGLAAALASVTTDMPDRRRGPLSDEPTITPAAADSSRCRGSLGGRFRRVNLSSSAPPDGGRALLDAARGGILPCPGIFRGAAMTDPARFLDRTGAAPEALALWP